MEITNLQALSNCLTVARDAGVPIDQAKRLVESGYIPLPWQWQFHAAARSADLPDGPVDIGTGGARGPGKSHAVLSQAALDDCQRVANLKGLFLRQTGLAAKESFDDLVDKVVRGHVPHKKVGSTLRFDNGSRIILGGFKDQNDIDKYIGIEYDFIIVEELNQLTEDKYNKLRGSLRTSKPNWRPRMYTSFNPGGVGHQFVKSRYITPHREKTEKDTRFIGSTYRSNPYLNKEYIAYLEGLQGDLAKAWRDGEWDIFAGQVFSEFSRIKHTIKPLIPALSFDHFTSMDWGYTGTKPHSFSFYAHALIRMKSDDGENYNRIITYKEWCGNLKAPHQWAEKIYLDCVKMGIHPKKGYADPANFNTQTDGSKAISSLMMNKWTELHKRHWLTMSPGGRNRIARVAIVHNWLSIAPDGLPYWIITENCVQLINTLPQLISDEHNLEDVETDGPDDPYDSCGSFLSQAKFISVKAGPFSHAKKAEVFRMKYNSDNQQIAFSPEEFSKQYDK